MKTRVSVWASLILSLLGTMPVQAAHRMGSPADTSQNAQVNSISNINVSEDAGVSEAHTRMSTANLLRSAKAPAATMLVLFGLAMAVFAVCCVKGIDLFLNELRLLGEDRSVSE